MTAQMQTTTTTPTTSVVSLIMPNNIKHALAMMARRETRSFSGQAIHLLKGCLDVPDSDNSKQIPATGSAWPDIFKEAIIEANVTMRRATLSVILNRRPSLAKLSERELQDIVQELIVNREIVADTSLRVVSYRIAGEQ